MSNHTPASSSHTIIVLGMHRSGTSALTRILNLLGVELGTQLLPEHVTNETGFWEHLGIVRANEKILEQLDSCWFDSAPLPAQWWTSSTLIPLRQQLSQLLQEEFAVEPLWGIKDPRLCRLLPLWIPLLQELGSTVHFVIIVRHPLEVAASLEVRDGLSYNTSLRLWLEYVLTSEQDSRSYSRVLVTYDELLQDWSAVVTKIAQQCQITWSYQPQAIAESVNAFLDINLKHHQITQFGQQSKPPYLNRELWQWSHTVYQALCQAAQGNNEQLPTLNTIKTVLDKPYSSLYQQIPITPQIHLLIHLSHQQYSYLSVTLSALRAQQYQNWYLSIIADFSPTDSTLWELRNVRWLHIQSNQPVIDTLNCEITVINAEWVALLTAGDSFEPELFSLCIQHTAHYPQWQFIYVDEDKNADDPQFKPDFNLDLLRATPYLGHFGLIRRKALQAVGGYVPYSQLENYDIALKIWERYGDEAVGHIAKLLYHHFPKKNSLLKQLWTKKNHDKIIIEQHLRRQNIQGKVFSTRFKNIYRIDYALAQHSLISIIIATRNGSSALQRCLHSLLTITTYTCYELIVVNNNSDDFDTLIYLENLIKKIPDHQVQLLSSSEELSPAAFYNLATEHAQGDYLLFLNDDIEIVQPEWLHHLLAYNQRHEVGIVAPRLLDSHRRLQHAGFILGMGQVGIAGQSHSGLAEHELGYMGRAQATQNVSAVSESCLMIKKSVYQQVGGMDAVTGNMLFNEVDLCLKVTQAGYKMVWIPQITLIQHNVGSINRNRKQLIDNEKMNQEVTLMHERWLPQLSSDPAYNPNLSLTDPVWQPETQFQVPWVGTIHLTQADQTRIIAFPHDNWGCSEYRLRAPLRVLQQAGLAEYALMPNEKVGRIPTLTEFERMQADTLLVHHFLHDEQLHALQQYRRFSRCFKIIGQDDLLYALPKTNPYSQTNYKDIKQRLYRAISWCDRLIVTTEPLADAYHHRIDDIQIIPNYLEYARWQNLSPQRCQSRKPRVGWAGAAQHQGDLSIIVPLVIALAKEVEWIFLGRCPEPLRPYLHEHYDMVPFDQYPAKLASLNLDLAIAPLEHNAFNEAKSNLRLLEYGVLGYPVICSDIYPYQSAPVTRVANTQSAWLAAVREQINDLDAAAATGNKLKQWVIDNWLLEDHIHEWGQAVKVTTTKSQPILSPQATQHRWIFLLSCEPTGTDLLAQLLCQHPAIREFIPDPDLLPTLGNIEIPVLWTEQETVTRLSAHDKPGQGTRLQQKWQQQTCDYPETRLLLTHLPASMCRTLWWQQHFREAYFIHVVRNGYAVALDMREQIQQEYGTLPLLLHRTARQWRRSLEILQADTPKLHHFLEIHYEVLLHNPETVLNQVADFLDLKPSELIQLTDNNLLSTLAAQQANCLACLTAESQAVIRNSAGKMLS